MGTWVGVKVNSPQYDASDFVKAVEMWESAVDTVGRFKITFARNKNGSTLDVTKFGADVDVEIKVLSLIYTAMKGYMDKAQKIYKISPKSIMESTFEIIGRNYGQDLNNKQVTKTWKYQPADDIIANALSISGSEITFASPSEAPNVYHPSKDQYLIDLVREILEKIHYDGRVNNSKVWEMWQQDTVAADFILRCMPGESNNNILFLAEVMFDALELKNYIVGRGPLVDDGYSEENAEDFTPSTGATIADEYAKVKKGIASIKVIQTTNNPIGATLSFPRYNHDYLDFARFGSETLSVWCLQWSTVPTTAQVLVKLKDTNNNVIRYQGIGNILPDSSDPADFKQITAPVGRNCDIHSSGGPDKWSFETGSSFNWLIKEITVEIVGPGAGQTGYLVIDGLNLPVEMVAYAQDSGSQTSYKVRYKTENAGRISSQKALQDLTDTVLLDRKLPLGSMKIVAKGTAGLSGLEWQWIPALKVRLKTPDHDYTWYRMLNFHHILTEEPQVGGFDWIVEVDLVPVGSNVDTQRSGFVSTPRHALAKAQDRRIDALNKKLLREKDYSPPLPIPVGVYLPSIYEVNYDAQIFGVGLSPGVEVWSDNFTDLECILEPMPDAKYVFRRLEIELRANAGDTCYCNFQILNYAGTQVLWNSVQNTTNTDWTTKTVNPDYEGAYNTGYRIRWMAYASSLDIENGARDTGFTIRAEGRRKRLE